MLKLVRHPDAKAFRDAAIPYLLKDEAAHNVIIGITDRLQRGFEMTEEPFLAHVEDENGAVISCAMRTPPHGVQIAHTENDDAIALIVKALIDTYGTIPSVGGRVDNSEQFVNDWQRMTGQAYKEKMRQGIYKLTQLTMPENVSGEAKLASENDRDTLVRYFGEFDRGTGLGARTPEQINAFLDLRLGKDAGTRIWLWWDDGEPVSMAGLNRLTLNGACISYVYTPEHKRRNGYASAVTAHASKTMLDEGREFCCLYTDMANPTSNKIYKAMGYVHICDHSFIEFINT